MKIGFLGGSFDPVHLGHLMAAQDAYEQFRLDRLVFVPAAQAPLKPAPAQASGEDRLAMLRFATEGDSRFEVSEFELRRGGTSFTVETARHFHGLHPDDHLFWLIGTDQVGALHLWKDISVLAAIVEFIVLRRPGSGDTSLPDIPNLHLHHCNGHPLEISSTELRRRAQQGQPLNYFVPDKVLVYIRKMSLYRAA